MVEILSLTHLSKDEAITARQRLREIFFITSTRQTFADDTEREKFFHKWTSFYFVQYPQEIFFALDENRQVLGYLTGCSDSAAALADLSAVNPAYDVFADLFADYPAHLHINLDPTAQGKGVGRKLIENYDKYLFDRKIGGVHLITSPTASNVAFYEKCGFTDIVDREYKSHGLRFMGKKLY